MSKFQVAIDDKDSQRVKYHLKKRYKSVSHGIRDWLNNFFESIGEKPLRPLQHGGARKKKGKKKGSKEK